MPTFEYQALSSSGQKVAGILAGASEQAVLSELETRKLVPVAIKERGEGADAGAFGGFESPPFVQERGRGLGVHGARHRFTGCCRGSGPKTDAAGARADARAGV